MSILNHYKPRYPHYKHFEPGRFFEAIFLGVITGSSTIMATMDTFVVKEAEWQARSGEVTGEVGECLDCGL